MEQNQYEEKVKEIESINKEHISTFKKWLKEQELSEMTIKKHINNVDFYINYYLNYYDPQEVKAGCYCIDGYLGSFFIRKALFSSCPQIKSNAASIKKFYACMLAEGIVDKDDYAHLCEDIKEGMEEWLDNMRHEEEAMKSIDIFDDLLY